jgi:UDP-glucose:(heptosyl)LPS alpha-1,3-glucosyltransferase
VKRFRIAYLVHDYSRAFGHGRYVVELATRFAKLHDVHVFANTFAEPAQHGMTYHPISALRRSAMSTVLSFILPAERGLKKAGRFDLVHSQGVCGLSQDIATAHFCQAAWYAELRKQQGHLTWKQRLSESLLVPLDRRVFQTSKSKRVIAVSKQTQGEIERFYYRREGITAIHHGVDLERFHPENKERYFASTRREWGVGLDEKVCLFVGNVQKGALKAIEAMAATEAFSLVIVTRSDTARERQRIAELGLENRVKIRPATDKIETAFAAADVFLFPTIYEPYGMVISEAMASGVCVVTSKLAGAAELITDGEDGVLLDDPGNVAEIAGKLNSLASTHTRCADIGSRSRRTIEYFSWDKAAERHAEVYRDFLGDSATLL